MLYWYKNCITGIVPAVKYDRLRERIKAGKPAPEAWVLTLADNPEDQLALFNAAQLKQSYYKTHPVYIVGIAAGRRDGLNMIKKLTEDTFAKTGGVDLRAQFPKEVFET